MDVKSTLQPHPPPCHFAELPLLISLTGCPHGHSLTFFLICIHSSVIVATPKTSKLTQPEPFSSEVHIPVFQYWLHTSISMSVRHLTDLASLEQNSGTLRRNLLCLQSSHPC